MLALALVLDALFGEPDALWRRVPHPAVLMGRGVTLADEQLNTGENRRGRGIAAVAILVMATSLAALVLSAIPLAETLGAAILLAHRSLVDHVRAVADALRQGLPQARAAVALIVGRDPDTLDETGVARAAIESAGENFSDAVVAPVFWFAVAGLPGMAVYKMVNTADSMIGHRTPRYEEFGWAAARLDDLLNWIPARLTGLLFCLVGGGREAMETMRRDAPGHKSVNAGWPEAALAASLGVRIAGPRVYAGRETADPWINREGRETILPADIEDAVGLLWRAWWVLLAGAVLAALI